MRIHAILLMIATMLLVACHKDELEPTELTSNPFDSDYVGADLFSLDGAVIESYVEDLVTYYRYRVRVRVHTELLLPNQVFSVRMQRLPDGPVTSLHSSQLQSDLFSVLLEDFELGNTYCWSFSMGNNNEWGGGNNVCYTVE